MRRGGGGETSRDGILGAHLVENADAQRASDETGEDDAGGGDAHHLRMSEERGDLSLIHI